MKRFLTLFNAAGVLALVIVSVFQWRESSALRHRRDELDRIAESLSAKLVDSEGARRAADAAVEEFRRRVESLEADNARLGKSLRESEARGSALATDVARLEKALAAWKAAVAERDKSIAALNDSLREQAEARDEAVSRYNTLVVRHNELVKRVTEAERLAAAATIERDRAVAELNAALAVNGS